VPELVAHLPRDAVETVWPLVILVFVALGALSLRGVRWAYLTFVLLGVAFLPASTWFRFEPRACELTCSVPLALTSLLNYPHILLFGLFFAGTLAQSPTRTGSAFAWAGVATLLMGAVVELEQGLTGRGHCRLRDLIPDAAGALLAATVVFGWGKARGARSRDMS
jgi:hypothetical protein